MATRRRVNVKRNGLKAAESGLEAAMVTLIQNQAQFVSQMAAIDRREAELRQETADRFARIEALLLRHEQLLAALPDAIKEKIGFN